ncbi:MAG: iron-sulfur cluster repair di-iron protein [Actinobacteria bacterium]|nr:iron-sulfur cluster repair di-iron protein [Actinomycetota bacterium]
MEITQETSVGHIATTIPASIDVFERFGVDFCCGGDKPLSEALRGTGVSVGDLLAEIEAAVAALASEQRLHEDWSERDPASLADHVERAHHIYLREKLPYVGEKMATVLRVHGELHPELFELGRLLEHLRKEIDAHLETEETVVFPALREIVETGASGTKGAALEDSLQMLETEHDEVGRLLKAMRGITSNYHPPAGACATYSVLFRELQALEADIHRHVHLENNIMFAAARKLIRP